MAADWYVQLMGSTIGPIEAAELKEMAAKGQVAPEDLVRHGDSGKWSPASAVKGLFSGAAAAMVAPPRVVPPTWEEEVSSTEAAAKRDMELVPARERQHTPAKPAGNPGFFDVHFNSFVSPTVITIVYVLNLLVGAAIGLGGSYIGARMIGDAENGAPALAAFGLAWIIASWIMAALIVLLSRLGLESIAVLFRIETHLRSLADRS